MKLFVRSLILATTLSVSSANVLAAQAYGVSVRMFGWPDSTADYAFAYPGFSFTNLSTSGVAITSLSMDDGSASGLWDVVSNESASAGVSYALTQGDYINNVGWSSSIGYSFTGFDAGNSMQFHVDPDTYHAGTGNVVDARPYVFNGGTVTANFSNGHALTLTWNNPIAQSFSPLRREDLAANDERNIYYEMSQFVVVTAPVPEPETYALMLAGLGLVGIAARRRRRA